MTKKMITFIRVVLLIAFVSAAAGTLKLLSVLVNLMQEGEPTIMHLLGVIGLLCACALTVFADKKISQKEARDNVEKDMEEYFEKYEFLDDVGDMNAEQLEA